MILKKGDITKTTGQFKPKAIILMIDEMSEVASGNFKLSGAISENIGSIARLGRAAGTHLVLASQRPSNNVISADLKNNIQQSVLLGNFDVSLSNLIFDRDISDQAKPEIKGRGFCQTGNDIIEFQSYYISNDKFIQTDHKELSAMDEYGTINKAKDNDNIDIDEFEDMPMMKPKKKTLSDVKDKLSPKEKALAMKSLRENLANDAPTNVNNNFINNNMVDHVEDSVESSVYTMPQNSNSHSNSSNDVVENVSNVSENDNNTNIINDEVNNIPTSINTNSEVSSNKKTLKLMINKSVIKPNNEVKCTDTIINDNDIQSKDIINEVHSVVGENEVKPNNNKVHLNINRNSTSSIAVPNKKDPKQDVEDMLSSVFSKIEHDNDINDLLNTNIDLSNNGNNNITTTTTTTTTNTTNTKKTLKLNINKKEV